MAKETWVLVNKENKLIECVIRITKMDQYSMELLLTTCESGDDKAVQYEAFIAEAVIKWDGCSHWYFNGEDSLNKDLSVEDKNDAYYHLCGFYIYSRFIMGILFAYKLATMKIENFDKDKKYDYKPFKRFEKLLDDYTIEESNGRTLEDPVPLPSED